MASPRITKTMRERIVANTLDNQFGKDLGGMRKRETKLADRVYHEQYRTGEINAMKLLGSNFVGYNNQMYVNVNGKSINLRFLNEERPMQRNAAYARFVPSAKLTADIESYIEDEQQLNGDIRKAEIALTAVLESVQSFKKLRAVWPQGVKFYDMYDVDSETKAGVPAVVVTQLNALLGIK